MPELQDKNKLADAAKRLAQSYELVQLGSTTFIPVHWQTLELDPLPPQGERIWMPLQRDDERKLANQKFNVLFASDGELRNFDFMVKQFAKPHDHGVSTLLVRTDQGLKALDRHGKLVDHDGSFTPNFIVPILNEDPADKQEVFDVIVEWLGGKKEEATSLLHHLATALAPGWSAVKYVLLLGEGRNGKGVLLSMLVELLGADNVSGITRQAMAERSPTCVELNHKLLNVVFDGEMAYIKDSSAEKTLVAGEPLWVRMLYESGTTRVQTNALFIEGLNLEPKARDKSPALQKRLSRFSFPNVYALDKKFHQRMTGERMLGAFLALLIDHFVEESEVAAKLAPTKGSTQLQLEQVWIGSPIQQYLEHLFLTDPTAIDKLGSGDFEWDKFLASFKPWAMDQNLGERSDGDLLQLGKVAFDIRWKAKRDPATKTVKNRKVIKALRPETLQALEQMKGEPDGTEHPDAELVGD